jgi:hypothetical protein
MALSYDTSNAAGIMKPANEEHKTFQRDVFLYSFNTYFLDEIDIYLI